MELASRVREAIKQTRIAIEQTDRPDALHFLERGLEQLENALKALEEADPD